MRRAPRANVPSGGFTLLEIMVVMVIIAILTAMAAPNLLASGRWRDLDREADTLAVRIAIAQDDAMLTGREYGIVFTGGGYHFVTWDAATSAFLAVSPAESRWAVREFDEGIRIDAVPEDEAALLAVPEPEAEQPGDAAAPAAAGAAPAKDEPEEPAVFVLSSGEVSAFRARFTAEGEEHVAELQVDALGRRVVGPEDADAG